MSRYYTDEFKAKIAELKLFSDPNKLEVDCQHFIIQKALGHSKTSF